MFLLCICSCQLLPVSRIPCQVFLLCHLFLSAVVCVTHPLTGVSTLSFAPVSCCLCHTSPGRCLSFCSCQLLCVSRIPWQVFLLCHLILSVVVCVTHLLTGVSTLSFAPVSCCLCHTSPGRCLSFAPVSCCLCHTSPDRCLSFAPVSCCLCHTSPDRCLSFAPVSCCLCHTSPDRCLSFAPVSCCLCHTSPDRCLAFAPVSCCLCHTSPDRCLSFAPVSCCLRHASPNRCFYFVICSCQLLSVSHIP